ncbi:hypothetical protein ILUMI_02724 [Ignelater luminosus]|uniref:BTB domain-containing protein n=1 Tax=Ignelater luminosus TaxID=2038154 RepID=A0A8K0GJ06_IGNLU|nr:hypothetical protein ILUMI_02724 [Ignelater luminosus]
MSEDYYESALSSLLKEQDRNRLLKILNEIRKGVEGPNRKENVKKLYEKGCLIHIVRKLQEPHFDILNFCLSILGYCCMERVCAREAVKKFNLLQYLGHLLKHFKQNSIQGRIFRIIGNLCDHWERLANVIIEKEVQLHIIAKIVSSIDKFATNDQNETESVPDNESEKTPKSETNSEAAQKKMSEGTLMMALRALRKLLNSGTVLPLIRDCHVVKVLGSLLIKFTPLWESTKEHEEVLKTTLNLIFEYSTRHQTYDIIKQLHTTSKGNAMECLEKLVILNPLIVMKISVTLGEVQKSKSDIPFAEISRTFIQILQDPSNFECGRADPRHSEYLKYLCFIIKQPFICSSRERILECNLIPMLFSILNDCKSDNEASIKNQIIVISTLKSRYIFEDLQRCILLKNGIVDILSDLLDHIVGPDLTLDTKHRFRAKKNNDEFNCLSGCKDYVFPVTCISDVFQEPYPKRCLSPCSDTSSGPSCSPPCSPAMSLGDVDFFDNESSDSDNYSPVCSDAEGESPALSSTVIDEGATDEFENERSKDSNHVDEQADASEPSKVRQRSILSLKKQLLYEIVNLIRVFVLMRPVPMELNSSSLLIKLLKLFLPSNKLLCTRDTVNVIKLIAQTPEYLIGLMQTDFVMVTHSFLSISHGINCSACANMLKFGQTILIQLTKVIEKGCGQGDIAHQLYRANLSVKEKLVPAIPFITNNKKILYNLFITCGGLDVMIQLFRKSTGMQKGNISSLCVLATRIGIKNPVAAFNETGGKYIDLPIDIQNYAVEQNCATVVRFKLDDGTCVEADREFLSERSDYFNRLLYGLFKESEENEIRLSNVSSKSLKLLLMLLQYDLNSTDVHKINVELDTLLDVIVLTDRYIMEDLCVCLTTSVQYFKLLSSTIPTIYQWSLESRTNILRVESIAYALVGCMNDNNRYDMFENLLQLGYVEQIADDLHQLLLRFFHS